MKKLIFYSSLLFCCMSLVSMDGNLTLENLRDTDGNTIKINAMYIVRRTNCDELTNTYLTTKGSKLVESLAGFEHDDAITIEKKQNSMIRLLAYIRT